MNWKQESENLKENENRETEERIRDIRRRIAELRDALHTSRPEPSHNDDEVSQPTQYTEKSKEEKRNAELEDMKAKLLGRKK